MDPFREIRDELGNTRWLVDDQRVLVSGQRYSACEGTFETLATELNPSGLAERATVNGIG